MFLAWLEAHYPLARPKVENLLRDTRSGELYQSKFGRRMCGKGPYADGLKATFNMFARKYVLNDSLPPLDVSSFRPPGMHGGQKRLF
jgi:hypothetical protein